jgi:hypothetical protein
MMMVAIAISLLSGCEPPKPKAPLAQHSATTTAAKAISPGAADGKAANAANGAGKSAVFRGFERIAPIADADPAVRRRRTFQVPTRLLLTRSATQIGISVDQNSLETIALDVGANMVVGFECETSATADGRKFTGLGRTLTGSTNFGTHFVNTSIEGIPQPGVSYTVLAEVTLFETDIPPQHLWMPHGGKYRKLWTRTLRQKLIDSD